MRMVWQPPISRQSLIPNGGTQPRTRRISRGIGLGCLVLALSMLLGACGSRPLIFVEQTSLDLGDVVNGEIVVRELEVKNTGQADLIIDAVTSSCGCTRASLEPMTIPPGGHGTLHIEFDSGAHGPDQNGELIRQIFIASNDPDQPEAIVELIANVLPPAGA